ncbi:hypothetical protein ACFRMQ_15915 [Kitasatospora sp. NPDC056783]|uniref:hypothetical protein n=1 Tax=Kitasatospora sp. NPDC056783 TaxID=3345943 RepID=UPI0036C7FD29
MSPMAPLLDGTVVASAAAALLLAPGCRGRKPRRSRTPRPRGGDGARSNQTFGTPELAALAGLLVIGAAVRRDARRLLLPALAGATVGYAVSVLAPGPYYEATLLRSATGALLTTTAACALLDITRTRLVVHS